MEENNDNLPTSDDRSVQSDAAIAVSGTPAPDVTVEEEIDVSAYILKEMAALPPAIREYVNSARVITANQELIKKHSLSEDEAYMVYALELQAFFKTVPIESFPDLVWSTLPWPDEDEDRARALTLDILGNILLPTQVFLGDVMAVILSLGGDIKDYPVEQIELRHLTFVQGAEAVLRALGDDFVAEVEMPRLRHLVETRLRGVRDDGEFREQLMRAKKVGGLELSESRAERVIEVIGAEKQLTAYSEELKKKDVSPMAAPATLNEGMSDMAPEESFDEMTSAQIKALYSGSADEREGIKERMGRFRKVTDSDPMKMRDAFYEVLYPPDSGLVEPSFVLAGLLAMAEDGELMNLLGYDERIRELMRKYYVSQGMDDEAYGFDENPQSPAAMNVFLQIMLRGFAGFEPGNSARFGLRAVNYLKKTGHPEYADLVAFDYDTRDFRWLQPIKL